MSIKSKILIACLSLTAITLIFGLLLRDAQTKLGTMAVNLYDETFMSMSYLRSAQNTLLVLTRDLTSASSDPDETAQRLDSILEDTDVSKERALSPEGRQIASSLHVQLEQIAHEFEQTHHLPSREIFMQLEQRFDTAVEINAGDGYRSSRTAFELVDRLSIQTWAAMAISLLMAVLITWLLSRAIVPAVKHAVGIASAIAAGHLNNEINASGRSETSTLLRALALMQRSISEKMQRIEFLMAEQASLHATEMASQHVRFETALDNMAQGLCMFDETGLVSVHNRRFAEMFGAAPAGTPAVKALPYVLLSDAASTSSDRLLKSFTRTLSDERSVSVMERSMPGGGWVATYEDVTERHEIEARMAFMARHDALTGLPNRVLYREQIEHALTQGRRNGGLAVFCLDLDHFKEVNEALGHSVGDGLLHAVAQRLLSETAEADMVVRLGGDEFAIIQMALDQPAAAQSLAEAIVRVLSVPFRIDEHELTISVSMGIAIVCEGLSNAETLLKSADLALHQAKADGRGTYRFFEVGMDTLLQSRRLMEADLRRAVVESQFENYYQPLVDVATRSVSGFEALIRWRHPTRGMVPPGEFISIAEEIGVISQIGAMVLQQACRDALTWPDTVSIAVNLSPVQFRNRRLAEEVAQVLRESGLPASRLELEITESLLLQDSDTILGILRDIRQLGVRIAMDDFGTGYSSLSYLRRFPFDKIKIDQSFVRTLHEDGDCIAIIRAVIGLGKSLGMRVIAEGVETEEQLAILQAEGCEQVQGYLFSRPRPIEAVPELLGTDAVTPAVDPEQSKLLCLTS